VLELEKEENKRRKKKKKRRRRMVRKAVRVGGGNARCRSLITSYVKEREAGATP